MEKVPDFCSKEYFTLVAAEETEVQHEPLNSCPLTLIILSYQHAMSGDLGSCTKVQLAIFQPHKKSNLATIH